MYNIQKFILEGFNFAFAFPNILTFLDILMIRQEYIILLCPRKAQLCVYVVVLMISRNIIT
jgi:hypothetical protein